MGYIAPIPRYQYSTEQFVKVAQHVKSVPVERVKSPQLLQQHESSLSRHHYRRMDKGSPLDSQSELQGKGTYIDRYI